MSAPLFPRQVRRSPMLAASPLTPPPADGIVADEERLRSVYAARQANDPRYSWTSPGHVFAVQERERAVLALLADEACLPLGDRAILEVGCGTGFWLREFVKWGARPERVQGIDLLPTRLDEARRLCPPAVGVSCASAARLPFRTASFDLLLQATVLTSVLDADVRAAIAAEMLRVVRPTGFIVWYDFWVDNPRNADVRGIGRRELRRLFPGCDIQLRRVGLAPPLARRLAPVSWLASALLASVPLLRTHYLGVIRRRSAPSQRSDAIP